MKYLVNTNLVNEEKFWREFEAIICDYVDDNLDELIDEQNEEVNIGSLTYSASQVLKNTDPVAYRCYASDLESFFYSNFKYELERYDEVEINGTIFAIENEEEAE